LASSAGADLDFIFGCCLLEFGSNLGRLV
jgi:hypothetical protein